MSTYEELSLIVSIALLIVAILRGRKIFCVYGENFL